MTLVLADITALLSLKEPGLDVSLSSVTQPDKKDTNVYYGTQKCDYPPCKNLAYVQCSSGYYCNIHGKKKGITKALSKLNKKNKAKLAKEQLKSHLASIPITNIPTKRVELTRLMMMKLPEWIPGCYPIAPNSKHQEVQWAKGLSSLSPMRMLNVRTGFSTSSVTVAKNLENMWQYCKVYEKELNAQGKPGKAFHDALALGFDDNTPHRRKYHKGYSKIVGMYWMKMDGEEVMLDYVESRFIYCWFYSRIAQTLDDFSTMQHLMKQGIPLQIIGYDAHPLASCTKEEIYRAYRDSAKPFGHELVLTAMLVLDEIDWPWLQPEFKLFELRDPASMHTRQKQTDASDSSSVQPLQQQQQLPSV